MSSPRIPSRFMAAILGVAWIAILFLPMAVTAQAGPTDSRSELPLGRGLNQRVSNFTLKNVASDRTVSLYSYVGKKAIVLVFLGTDCPVGNLYVPRLIELNHAYQSKGVIFLGINSNAHESEQDVAKYVREMGVDFPVLKDTQNTISDLLLVERTCETLVLDGIGRIKYRGAIDDQYLQGKSKDHVEQTYLRDALDALLENRPIKVAATRVEGCLLDRVEPKPVEASKAPRVRAAAPAITEALVSRDQEHPVKVGVVTYAAEVSRIIQEKCQGCHRPNQVGPFSLLSYDDARKHSAMIREVVDDRRMPPWHADPRYGHFSNDRSLSSKERATLLAWIDQGTPLGDLKVLPAPRAFPDGWSIGKPDVIFELPETYYVPAQGVVSYVYFRIPTNFKEDRWIQAAEAVPGDPSVVHHIVVYLMDRNNGPGRGRGPGQHFCGYAPGDLGTVLPEGTAKKIPAGSELILQVHYTPIGRIRADRSKVGFIFAKTKPTRQAYTIGIANPDLMIPAERDDVAVSSAIEVPQDMRLVSFMPHMHLRGKDFKYTITRPGESPQVVLSVPAYDFGWQTYYVLKEPILLPKGSRIDCLAHFDNSSNNPYNPDPKKLVRWGEQTFEEMMIGYVDLDVPVGSPPIDGSELRPASIRATQNAIQALRRLGSGSNAGPNQTKPSAR
ncbi:MAG: redoxin domain-containing protein [Isosphaeraceae bacterium]